jgi:3-oxo-5-alpha-steroid 4-dehydrogenase 1
LGANDRQQVRLGINGITITYNFCFTGSPWTKAILLSFLGSVQFMGYPLFQPVGYFSIKDQDQGKKMPLLIMFSAVFFNLVNASLNGYWLGFVAPPYPENWMIDPRFILGGILFISGFIINLAADKKLIGLRKGGKTGYFIPRGGMFNYISCPNFFGEIIEWSGFALMAWNLPALSFAVWTAANLIPRALDHHRWYKSYFKEEYPKSRKAVIPFII